MGNSNSRKRNIYPYKRNDVYPYNVRGGVRDRQPYAFTKFINEDGYQVTRYYRCSVDGKNLRFDDEIMY